MDSNKQINISRRNQTISIGAMAIASLVGAGGQLLAKQTALRITDIGIQPETVLLFIVVFALYGGVMGLFLVALKYGKEMSQVYPIYALTFVWGVILGKLVFLEPMEIHHFVGVGIICLGVVIMHVNHPSTWFSKTKERP
jgi:uncharacterized membrane protein